MNNIVSDQLELFITQLADLPSKNDVSLLEYPFFGLTKRADTRSRDFDFGEVRISIEPSKHGVATIWDKDILIYCFNLMKQTIDEGGEPSQKVVFPIYNYLKSTYRDTGKAQYEQFIGGIKRLLNTTITTDIRTERMEKEAGFHWINAYRVIKRKDKHGNEIASAVEIELSDWIYRAALDKRCTLSMNPEYFHLSMGLERRFYELARKHCGHQATWECYLTTLHEKSGSQDELKSFAQQMRKIIQRDNIPDYRMELLEPENTPRAHKLKLMKVRFFPRDGAYARGELKAVRAMPLFEAADAQPPALPAMVVISEVPSDAIVEAAKAVARGYDVMQLWAKWRAWAIERGEPIKSQRGAFLAFCRTHAERNPLH